MFSAVRSGDALLAFDERMQVVAWSTAAERITGIPADQAIGRKCWQVLGGRGDDGSRICHAGCTRWHTQQTEMPMTIPTDRGPRRTSVATVHVAGPSGKFWLHLFR